MTTELELPEAFSGLSQDTTPIPNKVRHSGTKNLSVDDKSIRFTLFEESLATGQVPEDWSYSYLKPITIQARTIASSDNDCAFIVFNCI